MSIARPGGRGSNGASLSRHGDNVALSHLMSGKHNGKRRPASRFMRDETYQLKAHGFTVRAAGAAQGVQRGT